MDLPARFKEYAKTHVETISKEYSSQIGKWKAYLNLVADAQVSARDHFQNTLVEIAKAEAEADKFAFMALSFIGIVGAAWIGALVELAAYPKFMGKVVRSDGFKEGKYFFKSKLEYNEMAAKVFGDSIHELTGHVLDKTFELVMPEKKSGLVSDAFWNSIQAGTLGSFKTNLENRMLAEAGIITGQLAILSENINQRQDFGELVQKELDKRFPHTKSMKGDAADKQREVNGMTMLDEYFDKLRQGYANDWFYYGNNPLTARLGLLPFHIEIEIWALWILVQEWKMKTPILQPATFDGDGVTPVISYWKSEDFDLDDIMKALNELAGDEIMTLSRSIFKLGSSLRSEVQVTSKLAAASERGDEDTDLAKVLNWAKTVPGKMLNGELDYRPRRIGTVGKIGTVFAD